MVKKAVELDALNSDFHLWLGQTYGMRTRDASIFKKPFLAKKSKKHYELAVELDSTNADAVKGVIYYFCMLPAFSEVIKDKAVELSKRRMRLSEPLGRIVQARIYETKKEWQLAEEQYKFLEQTGHTIVTTEEDGYTQTFTYSVNEDTLTLISDSVGFDFEEAVIDVPATFVGIFERV